MKTKTKNRKTATEEPTSHGKEQTIEGATASYEAWMRSCTKILQSDLRSKHEQMKESPFGFLRGAFYRWAQLWPSVCSDLCGAPKVLAVGDLHVNSFGTWRDQRAGFAGALMILTKLTRLPIPMTSFAGGQREDRYRCGRLSIKLKDGCNVILEGYMNSLRQGGFPIVLAERDQKLGKLGVDSFKPPSNFWEKLNRLPVHPSAPHERPKARYREDAARGGDRIQGCQEASRVGEPGPRTIRSDRQLARRMYRARGKVDGSIRLVMAQ